MDKAPRTIIDLTTLLQAGSRNDGICRTVREIAKCAAANWENVVFAVYDVRSGFFLELKERSLPDIFRGAAFDFHFGVSLSDFMQQQSAWSSLVKFLKYPRRQLFSALETLRLRRGERSRFIDWLQTFFVSRRNRARLFDSDGNRYPLIPLRMAIDRPITLTATDVVLSAGSDWPALRQLAESWPAKGGPRLVVLCYDIIPLLFPQFFIEGTATAFRACFDALFPASSLVVFISEQARSDAEAYCEQNFLRLENTAVIRLGANLPRAVESSTMQLPDFLAEGKYALFVSTIEPRKGHGMLLRVWQRLLSEQIPQEAGFKLVFVGVQGWLVGELIEQIDGLANRPANFHWLSNVEDNLLAKLYSEAAFCVYPSIYEGYGLPIVEAFLRGKAVIASSGGAIPEVVSRFGPCIDPLDEQAWYEQLRLWIQQPTARASFERLIKEDYEPQTWMTTASELSAIIQDKLERGSSERSSSPPKLTAAQNP